MILANIANIDNFELYYLVMEKLWYGRRGTPNTVIGNTVNTDMDIIKVYSVDIEDIDSDSSSGATDIT